MTAITYEDRYTPPTPKIEAEPAPPNKPPSYDNRWGTDHYTKDNDPLILQQNQLLENARDEMSRKREEFEAAGGMEGFRERQQARVDSKPKWRPGPNQEVDRQPDTLPADATVDEINQRTAYEGSPEVQQMRNDSDAQVLQGNIPAPEARDTRTDVQRDSMTEQEQWAIEDRNITPAQRQARMEARNRFTPEERKQRRADLEQRQAQRAQERAQKDREWEDTQSQWAEDDIARQERNDAFDQKLKDWKEKRYTDEKDMLSGLQDSSPEAHEWRTDQNRRRGAGLEGESYADYQARLAAGGSATQPRYGEEIPDASGVMADLAPSIDNADDAEMMAILGRHQQIRDQEIAAQGGGEVAPTQAAPVQTADVGIKGNPALSGEIQPGIRGGGVEAAPTQVATEREPYTGDMPTSPPSGETGPGSWDWNPSTGQPKWYSFGEDDPRATKGWPVQDTPQPDTQTIPATPQQPQQIATNPNAAPSVDPNSLMGGYNPNTGGQYTPQTGSGREELAKIFKQLGEAFGFNTENKQPQTSDTFTMRPNPVNRRLGWGPDQSRYPGFDRFGGTGSTNDQGFYINPAPNRFPGIPSAAIPRQPRDYTSGLAPDWGKSKQDLPWYQQNHINSSTPDWANFSKQRETPDFMKSFT